MIIIEPILSMCFVAFGIFCIISLISFIRAAIKFKTLDELQKKAIYESLATSFLVVVAIHFIQLIVSIFSSETISFVSKIIISPGAYKGTLFGNSPVHFDSFMMDIIILGIVYFIKRKRYGLI